VTNHQKLKNPSPSMDFDFFQHRPGWLQENEKSYKMVTKALVTNSTEIKISLK